MATAKGIKAGDKPLHFNLEVLGYEGVPWKGDKRTINPPIAVRVTGRGMRGQLTGIALVHDNLPDNWMVRRYNSNPHRIDLKGETRHSFMMGSGSMNRLAEAGVPGLGDEHVRNCAEQWAKAHPLGLQEHFLAVALERLNKAEKYTAHLREQLRKAELTEAEADAALAEAKQNLAVAKAVQESPRVAGS